MVKTWPKSHWKVDRNGQGYKVCRDCKNLANWTREDSLNDISFKRWLLLAPEQHVISDVAVNDSKHHVIWDVAINDSEQHVVLDRLLSVPTTCHLCRCHWIQTCHSDVVVGYNWHVVWVKEDVSMVWPYNVIQCPCHFAKITWST